MLEELIGSFKLLINLQPVEFERKAEVILAGATDYAAEDVLSASASGGQYGVIENMSRRKKGGGTIEQAIVMLSTTALTPRVTQYIFNKPPTSQLNDNAANTAVITADVGSYQGKIDYMSMEDQGGESEAQVTTSTVGNLPLKYKCLNGRLYYIAITRDAITGEASGMKLTFKYQTIQTW
ncbi:hypothetical protein LCGC14_0382970 [marine sediment metagenome]|uniref:Uncharacterized protein n=1 Tax=marine sediment metagenome TaxID=412755 RepID=A0A0F9WAH7_9ZZZZ